MEEIQETHRIAKLRPYWRFFIPLAVFLMVMVKFPIQINIGESFYEIIFYGTITMLCVMSAVWVYWHFRRVAIPLITLILWCSIFAGWQVLDLGFLREEMPSYYSFAGAEPSLMGDSPYTGTVWYRVRFRDENIMCHSRIERYFGNQSIAITILLYREATWFACGG